MLVVNGVADREEEEEQFYSSPDDEEEFISEAWLYHIFTVHHVLPPPPTRVGSRTRPVSRGRGVGVKNLSLVHQQFPSNPITPT